MKPANYEDLKAFFNKCIEDKKETVLLFNGDKIGFQQTKNTVVVCGTDWCDIYLVENDNAAVIAHTEKGNE